MENNEIINVQMTKEVFETLGSGGNGGGNKIEININTTSENIEKTQYCYKLQNLIDISNINSLDDLPDIINLNLNNTTAVKFTKIPNSFVYFGIPLNIPYILTLNTSTGEWYQVAAMFWE